jgi:hypothetical protein
MTHSTDNRYAESVYVTADGTAATVKKTYRIFMAHISTMQTNMHGFIKAY